jgi:hypothetical protein
MDLGKDDKRTLPRGLLSEFKEQNSTNTIYCTAMKITWLSKRQSEKRVRPLVIWLEQPAAADHLLQGGMAEFEDLGG